MVIENRDAVVAGTKLVAIYKKQHYVCTVEAGEEGKLAFIYDGKSYGSPSSAGTAVIGTACNGWRFWSIDGAAPASTTKGTGKARTTTKATSKTKTSTRKPRTLIKPVVLQRHKNQKDLEEGQTRWLCNACIKAFIADGDATPETCPEGHRNDDPELGSAPAAEEVTADMAEAAV
jgi:hypothetical protein